MLRATSRWNRFREAFWSQVGGNEMSEKPGAQDEVSQGGGSATTVARLKPCPTCGEPRGDAPECPHCGLK